MFDHRVPADFLKKAERKDEHLTENEQLMRAHYGHHGADPMAQRDVWSCLDEIERLRATLKQARCDIATAHLKLVAAEVRVEMAEAEAEAYGRQFETR